MKKMKKLVAALLALGCIFAVGGLTACGESGAEGTFVQQGLGKLELNIQSHTMLLDQTVTLKTERRNVEVNGATWSSSNMAVATVDSNGVVTSVGFGEATITAKIGEEKATCLVRVPEVSTDGVVFANKQVKLTVGGQKTLEAMVTPSIASNKALTWDSADDAVATVDANGKVTGVAEGETTVTATTVDGGQTATCEIIVGKSLEGFALSETEITVIEGSTAKIQPSFTPADAIIQDLVWTSTNARIAVYSGMAVVGVREGTATLTATTVDGGFTASVTVTVLPYIDVESVTLDKEIVNLGLGASMQLSAAVLPENATDKKVKWLSSDMSGVTVDDSGFITAKKEGIFTVTAFSVSGENAEDSVEVNVIGKRATLKREDGTAEGDFTLTAYGVNEVKFNGTALAANEYTYENNVLTIAASLLAAKTEEEMNTLTVISAENGDVDVPVQFYDHYYEDFSKGANTALVGSNVAGNTYFTSTVVSLDGNDCLKWSKNSTATEPSFYFSNTTGNWIDKVRADSTIESISFDVKAGDAGKVPAVAFFCQWRDQNYVSGVVGNDGWVTFTIPASDYNSSYKISTGEYWMKIWYNEEKTDVPTILYYDNFRVNYAEPKDPYLADFEGGMEYSVTANNDNGLNYASYALATIDGNQCLKWTNKKTDAATLYFTDKADNWLSKVRADDTVEAIHFDVKAGDAGKTPTVAYFCQWKEPRYYAIAEAGENGWVTFTIPRTYLKDMSNANEYWMRLCYDEDAANVDRNNMTDIPTALYFDNFRVSYVQA